MLCSKELVVCKSSKISHHSKMTVIATEVAIEWWHLESAGPPQTRRSSDLAYLTDSPISMYQTRLPAHAFESWVEVLVVQNRLLSLLRLSNLSRWFSFLRVSYLGNQVPTYLIYRSNPILQEFAMLFCHHPDETLWPREFTDITEV